MNPSAQPLPASLPASLPRHTRIAGTGSLLPARRVSNADLAVELARQGIATSDDWIVERTGIRARHFVDAETQASDLAVGAARQAIAAAGCSAQDIDLIVLATTSVAATSVQRGQPAAGLSASVVPTSSRSACG